MRLTTRVYIRAMKRSLWRAGASCDVAPKRSEWRTCSRSESVPGGPLGSRKVRRVSGCACGSARRFQGRRGVGQRGAGRLSCGKRRVCTGSRGARAAALGRRARAADRGRLDACCAGLMRPFCERCCVVATPGLKNPTLAGALRVGFRWPARLLKRCAARLGAPVARRVFSFGTGARYRCQSWTEPPLRVNTPDKTPPVLCI